MWGEVQPLQSVTGSGPREHGGYDHVTAGATERGPASLRNGLLSRSLGRQIGDSDQNAPRVSDAEIAKIP